LFFYFHPWGKEENVTTSPMQQSQVALIQEQGRSQDFSKGGAKVMEAKAL